jgi:hypothetical protein
MYVDELLEMNGRFAPAAVIRAAKMFRSFALACPADPGARTAISDCSRIAFCRLTKSGATLRLRDRALQGGYKDRRTGWLG